LRRKMGGSNGGVKSGETLRNRRKRGTYPRGNPSFSKEKAEKTSCPRGVKEGGGAHTQRRLRQAGKSQREEVFEEGGKWAGRESPGGKRKGQCPPKGHGGGTSRRRVHNVRKRVGQGKERN